MLEIKNLTAKIEDKSILNGLSLSINPGEVHALMGVQLTEELNIQQHNFP